VEKKIAECDLVVLSKFGKLEAGGSGLLPVFMAARSLCKPVLTSVSDKHRAAWKNLRRSPAILAPLTLPYASSVKRSCVGNGQSYIVSSAATARNPPSVCLIGPSSASEEKMA
jgi:hypothetical protein